MRDLFLLMFMVCWASAQAGTTGSRPAAAPAAVDLRAGAHRLAYTLTEPASLQVDQGLRTWSVVESSNGKGMAWLHTSVSTSVPKYYAPGTPGLETVDFEGASLVVWNPVKEAKEYDLVKGVVTSCSIWSGSRVKADGSVTTEGESRTLSVESLDQDPLWFWPWWGLGDNTIPGPQTSALQRSGCVGDDCTVGLAATASIDHGEGLSKTLAATSFAASYDDLVRVKAVDVMSLCKERQ